MPRLAFLVAFLVGACARTTTDKADAYFAVFRAEVPVGVVVRNASFWENRHLLVFYEYESLLELDIDERALHAVMKSLGKDFQAFDATNFGFGSAPPWFAPRDGSTYQGWRSDDGTILIVRSSKTRRVFAERSEL